MDVFFPILSQATDNSLKMGLNDTKSSTYQLESPC